MQFSQIVDNEKKESTVATRKVSFAANTENVASSSKREVGLASDDKATSSSAPEVSPDDAGVAVAMDLSKHAIAPTALPDDECLGNGSAVPQRCQLQSKPGKYGVISSFDGVSSVVRVLTKKLGCLQRPFCLQRMMSQYGDWSVLSLDIELMKSGAKQRQNQLVYTFLMSTSLLKMIVFCFGSVPSLVSNGLLLEGPHARISPVLDTYIVYWI